jgi:hypothetical protein
VLQSLASSNLLMGYFEKIEGLQPDSLTAKLKELLM